LIASSISATVGFWIVWPFEILKNQVLKNYINGWLEIEDIFYFNLSILKKGASWNTDRGDQESNHLRQTSVPFKFI